MSIATGILNGGHTLIVDVQAGFGRAPKADVPDPIVKPYASDQCLNTVLVEASINALIHTAGLDAVLGNTSG